MGTSWSNEGYSQSVPVCTKLRDVHPISVSPSDSGRKECYDTQMSEVRTSQVCDRKNRKYSIFYKADERDSAELIQMRNLGYIEDNILTEEEHVCTTIVSSGTVSYDGDEMLLKNPVEGERKSAEALSRGTVAYEREAVHTDEDSDVQSCFTHPPPQQCYRTGILVRYKGRHDSSGTYMEGLFEAGERYGYTREKPI